MDRFVRKLKKTFEKMLNFFAHVDLIVAISFMLDCNFSGIGTIFYDIYSHHLAPIIFESFFKGYYCPKYRATWYFYDTIFYFSCLVNSGIEVHKFGFYHFWWRTERWAIGGVFIWKYYQYWLLLAQCYKIIHSTKVDFTLV